MASSYKGDVLADLIASGLDALRRGAAVELAKAAGVTPQTVTKWRKGEVRPDVDKWPAIEGFFGWEQGEIAALVTPGGPSTLTAEVRLLAAEVAALRRELDELRGQVTETWSLAAESAGRKRRGR